MACTAVVFLLTLTALWRLPLAECLNITLNSPTKLPPFVRRCSLRDPNIKKCCIDAGNDVLPKVMKGYPALHVHSLDPLVIDEITVGTGEGPSALKVGARNIVLSGLTNLLIDDIGIDLNNQIYTVFTSIPVVRIECDYEIDGKILVLPIKGHGKATFIFVKRSDGNVYHELLSHGGNFTTTRAHFHLDNLFNGDKVLSQQINNFLNENWREVLEDIGDPFIEAAIEVMSQFAHSLSNKIPYSELYMDFDLDVVEKMQKVIISS